MLCYVSMPDYVLTEFKIREKASGQDLLQAVRCFCSALGSKSRICFQIRFSDVTCLVAFTYHVSLPSLP